MEPITATNEHGEKVVFLPTWDSVEDATARALAKALEPEDRGYFFHLCHGARLHFVKTKSTRVARLLEAIYMTGFKGGLITAREAHNLIGNLHGNYQAVWKSLDRLMDWIETQKGKIEEMRWGVFFSEMPTLNISGQNRKKIAPRNHHKGKGSGKSHGRPEREFFIPRAYIVNALVGEDDQTSIAIPLRALEKDTVYKAYVWKAPIVKKSRISKRQIDMCAELEISRRTMKRYLFISGARDLPYFEERKLHWKRVANLPADRGELRKHLAAGEIRFKTVRDSSGMFAKANKQDIRDKGLEGQLYANFRTMTTFVDDAFDAWVVRPEDRKNALSNLFGGAVELK